MRYAPVGYGDYHWTADGRDGERWFITVKDPDEHDHDPGGSAAIAADLAATMTAAARLAAAGLEFVVAPLPTLGGTLVEGLAPHYCVTAFPHIDAEASDWGEGRGPTCAGAGAAAMPEAQATTQRARRSATRHPPPR